MSADFWSANNYYVGQSKIPAKVPPYHYGCRSRVIPYIEPTDPRKKLRDRLENYDLTESDLPGILSLAQQSSWKPGKLASHYKKHAKELASLSIESYNRRVYELIRDAGRNVAISTSLRGSVPYMALYVWKQTTATEAEFAVIDLENGNIQTAYLKDVDVLDDEISKISIKSIRFSKGGTVKKETRELDRKKYLITHYSWLPEYISDWDTWMADIPDSIVSRQQISPSELSPIERSLVASIDEELLSIDVPFDPVVTDFIEWLRDNRL